MVLCTKNGGDRLATCLQQIESLRCDAGVELVLVDNGSTDGISYERLLAFGDGTRFDCKVLQTLVPGNSAGRNLAIRHSHGDLIIFIDDDCYPDPSLVADWVRVFSERDIGFASGTIRRFTTEQTYLGCRETMRSSRRGDLFRGG
jgi:glycosyltransferase involved in cell wall biosynthesis